MSENWVPEVKGPFLFLQMWMPEVFTSIKFVVGVHEYSITLIYWLEFNEAGGCSPDKLYLLPLKFALSLNLYESSLIFRTSSVEPLVSST